MKMKAFRQFPRKNDGWFLGRVDRGRKALRQQRGHQKTRGRPYTVVYRGGGQLGAEAFGPSQMSLFRIAEEGIFLLGTT